MAQAEHESPTDADPESEWFGAKPVAPEEKTRLVQGVFAAVAWRYAIAAERRTLESVTRPLAFVE